MMDALMPWLMLAVGVVLILHGLRIGFRGCADDLARREHEGWWR